MRKFIKLYVEGCAECQQYKINRHPTKPTLMPIEGPKSTRPFSQIAADFITDLPESEGYDSILVVVDHGLMKGVILEPCTKKITAQQTADILLRRVFPRFGLPDKLISDRGPHFAAQAFQDLCRLLKIVRPPSTPCANGPSRKACPPTKPPPCFKTATGTSGSSPTPARPVSMAIPSSRKKCHRRSRPAA